jgi:hypothetical protein
MHVGRDGFHEGWARECGCGCGCTQLDVPAFAVTALTRGTATTPVVARASGCARAMLTSDLWQTLIYAAEGNFASMPPLEWDPRTSLCVVMAANGYPGMSVCAHVVEAAHKTCMRICVCMFTCIPRTSGQTMLPSTAMP